jgi:hypothetical protein
MWFLLPTTQFGVLVFVPRKQGDLAQKMPKTQWRGRIEKCRT